MTGPEHYREAERLVCSTSLRNPLPEDANKPGAAQVHATLALAAATAAAGRMPGTTAQAWDTATGVGS
ncbi:hypothetical protein [Amycolatopsis sp. FDAARGOS 1241]|uniref:hypothetical protein n=1 Tax=Amycolatopsis sp. FDAARGOS 1241 TaxID=2778070 RepID=UPI00195049BA|nr:hypothetical protein [Amycolatopsis sp. FDAARGOS 1241]QRP47418.1 hypothetical protein I6J71_05470 [Amycolatopsis sp. FDAARGOS 1241]